MNQKTSKFALLLVLLAACLGETGGPPISMELGGDTPDLRTADGGPPDGGGPQGCIGVSECACFGQRAACTLIAEPCHCPYPQCGGGLCACGGGKYLGCAPMASGCPSSVACRPAGRHTPQDAKGCVSCAYQETCEQAFAQMTETCSDKKGLLSAFSCARNPSCVTACINALARCEDIGCGLCAQCGCGRVGAFEQCVFKCNM